MLVPPASRRPLTSSPMTIPSSTMPFRLSSLWREEKCSTFTQPVWLSFAAGQELAQAETLLPAGVPLGIYRVEPEALARDGIDAAFQGEPYAPALDAAPIALPFHTPAERNQAQYCARMDNLCRWLSLGVEMLDMNAVYIDIDAEIGSGTVLLPGTILRGRTVIGENCEIGPNSMIRDCILGNGCVANASQLNQAQFGDNVNIGPFAYVRPGSVVGDGCKVGDFVELKNSTLGEGTKLPHLIYVGDSDVGAHCNFGCGSITCNYDGNYKYRTTVGDDAFIGCNTQPSLPLSGGRRSVHRRRHYHHWPHPCRCSGHWTGGAGHQTGLGKTASRQKDRPLMFLC